MAGKVRKHIGWFRLFLFGIGFAPLSIFLLGEFFFGASSSLLYRLAIFIGFTLLCWVLLVILEALESWWSWPVRVWAEVVLLFPFRIWQKGFLQLLYAHPLRSGMGAAFSLSCCIIFSYSTYAYWPRLTSKFSWLRAGDRKLSKRELAWEEYRKIRKILKIYRRKHHKYPPQKNWVGHLMAIQDPELQKLLSQLRVKKIGSTYYILDPWGTPYIYYPYRSWKFFRMYRLYSIHVPMMK